MNGNQFTGVSYIGYADVYGGANTVLSRTRVIAESDASNQLVAPGKDNNKILSNDTAVTSSQLVKFVGFSVVLILALGFLPKLGVSV